MERPLVCALLLVAAVGACALAIALAAATFALLLRVRGGSWGAVWQEVTPGDVAVSAGASPGLGLALFDVAELL